MANSRDTVAPRPKQKRPEELIDGPAARLMMEADGVSAAELRHLLADMAERVANSGDTDIFDEYE